MSKISNPAGAVRVLRSTVTKMAAEYKALERKLARVTATKDREFDLRMAVELDLERANADRDTLTAAAKDAIQAMAGGLTPPGTVRELSEALLHFARGTMRVIEQNNVEGAEQRERIRELEAAESARMLTLVEDQAIVNALSESRLGDMPPVEAVAKALRAEALEPIVVTRPSLPALPPGPFLRGEFRLMREYRPS